ncbi:MAG: DUF2524 domain-containing protein [Paenibacillus dendritiformis]|uniref:DUF2524 domain-containing protein n=1 Tax=Paenibacillus dendritiformis TaxID=130049 RepID=UPI00143DCFB9|nr:DUF2524 domain-containing protein [Paenibacillus dendritiformis]MDU5141306.1 DUF2524 domain-containing protein [Paenibacillus dendritiformis]NKI20834.1 DUF2524 domain-containing protein [Paenibacillus dendritiformis]NRF98536.1 DUF2524 domain-containing protein [Paenibacillus dendritiformis]GIO72174.1 hypothetical protein J27TS7_16880 [Paenibacillus dendritiformis]
MHNLDSSYDCSLTSQDVPKLKSELASLKRQAQTDTSSKELREAINRVENQLHFIKNKCSLR